MFFRGFGCLLELDEVVFLVDQLLLHFCPKFLQTLQALSLLFFAHSQQTFVDTGLSLLLGTAPSALISINLRTQALQRLVFV